MNILILSWRGPGHPHQGGAEQSTHQHAKGWIKAGHKVTLFTSYFPKAKEEEVVDGVNIIRRGWQIFGVQLEAFKWYLFEKHPEFDLVIDQFHGIPFFTPFYVREKKLAFIHEATKEVWRLNPWPKPFNLIPAMLGTIFEPLVFKFYKNIPFMTVSQSTKNDLMEWEIPKDNIRVIHNGFNNTNYPRKKKETKKTIIYLGALSKDKGIEDALQIFSILDKASNDWQFWVVGKGEEHYLKQLKKQTKRLGVDKRIRFFGYVSEEKKFELLSSAHILINPSIREGWGLVVLEAAAVGTPTVGYNVAGLRDSIVDGKTGILCDQNIVSCVSAVLSLMANQDKYQQMRRNCFEWAKKFSWQRSIRESLKLIESLVHR